MEISTLINEYAAGSQKLQEAIAGMTPEQINAAPVRVNGPQDRSFAIWPTSSRCTPTG